MQIESIKKQALSFLQRLSDVRFTGQVLFVIVVLLISWSGVKTIQTNYGLQKQIASLEKQNQIQALANENLRLQNEYFNSNQYLELAARQNFGLGAPGEKELLVPASVALANTIDIPEPQQAPAITEPKPTAQRNYQAWIDFFLHRQSD